MPDESSPNPLRSPDPILPSGLVLISTPIGNLGDMSPRGLAALRAADLIYCEDTRVTRKLLSSFAISHRLFSLNEQSEERRTPEILGALTAGKRVVLVSDAGTPLISDPGFRLVRAAARAGAAITAVPGPSAVLVALTLSGLPPYPFLYLGFLPARAGPREAVIAHLKGLERAGLRATFVWHEAPHRLAASLTALARSFGDREAAIARELTKRFEEVRRAPLTELAAHYQGKAVHGEITLVVGPAPTDLAEPASHRAELTRLLDEGMSVKDAVQIVAGASGTARREVYREALALQRESTRS